MCATFTDDDVGKRVENADGTAIGHVTAVEGNRARVETDPGLLDSIKAALGWESDRDDTVSIDGRDVREISDDAVRLEERFSRTGGHGRSEEPPGSAKRGPSGERPRDAEEAPPGGDRTVTEERGRSED